MTIDEAIEIIARNLSTFTGLAPKAITPTMHVVDDLAIESIDAVELLISVERETSLQFDVDQIEEVTTVQDLAERLVAAASNPVIAAVES